MSKQTRSAPPTALAATVLCLVSAAGVRAQTTLLDVQTAGGDTVATIRSDTMRLNVPLRLLPGGFVAEGAFEASTTVDPPATGGGTRMMWYPEKAAFRAGRVSGTQWDRANVGDYSTALGYNVTASGHRSTALGYNTNAGGTGSTALTYNTSASGFAATAMGSGTDASGSYSTAMGSSTTASGSYSTAMGINTTASGNYSTATGRTTTASGFISTAMGYYASTNGMTGAFVYGDASTTSNVTADADNQFVVRAVGGTYFYSNTSLTTGSYLAAGSGSWSSVSDVATKTDFRMVDAEAALAKIERMPVLEWSYRTQDPSIRHIGPTAQDFRTAFGLGENGTTISVVDADGVNMLAIQALAERTRALRSDNEALRRENTALEARLHDAEARLARVEALLEHLAASEREHR